MTSRRWALAIVAGAVLIAAVTSSTAFGNHMSISNQNWRLVFSPLRFTGTAGFASIACPVTLEGSFHSASIAKTAGLLLGYVNRASVAAASCTGGSARIEQEALPWHIRYESFNGTLPNITGIALQIVGAAFLITTSFGGCRYRTTAESPSVGVATRESGGAITGATLSERSEIPLTTTLSGFCDPRGRFEGTGRLTAQGSTAAISVTLI